MRISFDLHEKILSIYALFGVKFGLTDLLCVKHLTLCNSGVNLLVEPEPPPPTAIATMLQHPKAAVLNSDTFTVG